MRWLFPFVTAREKAQTPLRALQLSPESVGIFQLIVSVGSHRRCADTQNEWLTSKSHTSEAPVTPFYFDVLAAARKYAFPQTIKRSKVPKLIQNENGRGRPDACQDEGYNLHLFSPPRAKYLKPLKLQECCRHFYIWWFHPVGQINITLCNDAETIFFIVWHI